MLKNIVLKNAVRIKSTPWILYLRHAALATVISLGMTASSNAQTANFNNADMANRYADIHWPVGYSPKDANLFAHNEIFIKAPCSTIWQHLIEAPKWPQWYSNSHDVRILNNTNDILEQGTRFEFNTFGLHINAEISEFVPGSRLGWFGKGTDINAYHTWLLMNAPEGCHVITEEVAKGPAAIALRKSDPDAMHKGHELWLNGLKQISEK